MENKEYVSVDSIKGNDDKLKLNENLLKDKLTKSGVESINIDVAVTIINENLTKINKDIDSFIKVSDKDIGNNEVKDGTEYSEINKIAKALNTILDKFDDKNTLNTQKMFSELSKIADSDNIVSMLSKLEKSGLSKLADGFKNTFSFGSDKPKSQAKKTEEGLLGKGLANTLIPGTIKANNRTEAFSLAYLEEK